MKKRDTTKNYNNKRMLDTLEVCEYIGLGKNTARKYMDDIGATRRFGGRVLFDKNVIDKALDKLTE